MSERMPSTVARTLVASSARKAASRPRFRYSTMIVPFESLDCLRIDWRSGSARQMQRRCRKEELVDSVGRAILGELLQIKYLTHGNPDRWNDDPMPGLISFVGFVGTHLAAPGIRTDRGDILFAKPVAGFKCEARSVAARISAPILPCQAAFLMTGTNQNEIAFADFDTLRRRTGVEVGYRYRISVVERLNALETCNIEQHTASDHLVANVLNTQFPGAAGIDKSCVEAVIHLVIEEDVAKGIPLGRCLTGHVDGIVGVAKIGRGLVLVAGLRICSGSEHGMNRIPPAAKQAGLDRLLQGKSKCKDFTFSDKASRPDNIFRCHIVERSDLVLGSPTSPV